MNINSLLTLDSYDARQVIVDAARQEIAAGGSPYEESDQSNISQNFAHQVLLNDLHATNQIFRAFDSGKFPGEKGNVTIRDLMSTKDYPKLFYAATEMLMRERIVPDRIITSNLFQTIPYDGTALNVTIRTLGGVEVEEIPEGGPYSETSSAVSDQAYRINLEIKKYGAKVAATKELIESDYWGIYAFTIRALAQELLNKKERLGCELLNERAGYVLMDNGAAGNIPLGSCTGRGIDGNQNGSMTIDDIMNIMSWMQMRGYNIDTILLNPFAWSLWARDTEIREVMMPNDVTYIPQGSAAQGWEDPFNGLGIPLQKFGGNGEFSDPTTGYGDVDPVYGKLGIAPYSYPNMTPWGSGFYTQPKHLQRPVKILVSPFVPYYKISGSSAGGSGIDDPNGKFATNIIFAESSKCGLILQKENPVMEQWGDIEREIDFIKIRERYGMALQEQGRALAVAKNVVIDRNYNFENANSVTLSPLKKDSNMV